MPAEAGGSKAESGTVPSVKSLRAWQALPFADSRKHQALRIRAARNRRSMDQEARELFEAARTRTEVQSENLGEAIHRRFAAFGGVRLDIPPPSSGSDPRSRNSLRVSALANAYS